MWTAANALFARPAILLILEPTVANLRSELDKFKVLYRHSGIDSTRVQMYVQSLHDILRKPVKVEHFPWIPGAQTPSVLQVICHKYTTSAERSRGSGRILFNIAQTGVYGGLDLPTLIYATRNWNIHGALIGTSFRGTDARFQSYIDTVNLGLGDVLAGSASAILTRL